MFALERANRSARASWLSLLGLVLVPLLVAGGFLWATWDSDTRLDRVQAAVVNLDEGVTLNGKLVPLGRQLAGGLVTGGDEPADKNFAWLLTDAEDGAAGLADGRYAAVVTIPPDFSARATSFSKTKASQIRPARIRVETSQVGGIADSVVGQSIAAAATSALNDELTKQYLDNIYVGFNTTAKQFTTVAKAAGALSDGTSRLGDGLEQTATGSAKLSGGLDQLDHGAQQLSTGARRLSAGVRQLASGAGELSGGLDRLADGTAQLPNQTRRLAAGTSRLATGVDSLASGTRKLDRGARRYAEGVDAYADGARTYARGVGQAADGLTAYPKGVATFAGGVLEYGKAVERIAANGLPGTCPAELQAVQGGCDAFEAGVRAGAGAAVAGLNSPSQAKGLLAGARQLSGSSTELASGVRQLASGADELSAGARRLSAGADQIAGGTSGLASGTGKLASGADQLAAGTQQLADGMKPLARGISGASTGAAKLASGTSRLAGGAAQLADGTSQLATGTSQSATGASALSRGLDKLDDGGDRLADGAKQLADGLAAGADRVPTYDKNTRTRLADVVTTPVTAKRPNSLFADIANTTFLATVALWLGGLASFLVLRAVPSRVLTSMKSSWRLAAEAMAPGVAIAVVQAIALAAVLQVLLELRAGQVVALVPFLALAGVAFAVGNQALVAWLGGVGRFVSVVLVVLAAAAAITSALPSTLAALTPYLPLTPALEGARAIVSDGVGALGSAGLLLAWLLAGTAATVLAVARRRMLPAAATVSAR